MTLPREVHFVGVNLSRAGNCRLQKVSELGHLPFPRPKRENCFCAAVAASSPKASQNDLLAAATVNSPSSNNSGDGEAAMTAIVRLSAASSILTLELVIHRKGFK